jgi:hypothetical protein
MSIYNKRCFTVDKQKICEGDSIITESSKGKSYKHKIEGICGGYVILDSDLFGLQTQKIAPLRKRMSGSKFVIRKK